MRIKRASLFLLFCIDNNLQNLLLNTYFSNFNLIFRYKISIITLGDNMKNFVNDVALFVKEKINNILSKLLRVKDIFIEHPIRYLFFIILLILIVIIISIILFQNRKYPFINIIHTSVEEQIILIKGISLQNFEILISGIVIVIGGIWAMYQYDKSTKSKQQEKANRIAQHFSDNLILNITIIDNIMTQYEKMDEILTKIIQFNCTNFNIYEMKKVFTKVEILEYQKYINSEETDKKYQKFLKENYSDTIIQKYPKNFAMLLIHTLNLLEYLCIDISSNAAGSQYIYNSLHTIYFNLIEESYIFISSYNKTNVDLLYLNIINVYNTWQLNRKRDILQLKKTEKKIKRLDIKYDKNINKLLNKKIHRV